jgi:hypothetical protein
MLDAPGGGDDAIFTSDEERVLRLFDRLQELQLQTALVRAKRSHASSKPTFSHTNALECD